MERGEKECPLKGCNNIGNKYYDFLVVRNKRQGRSLYICRQCLGLPKHSVHGKIGV